jgi:hypothetical protein
MSHDTLEAGFEPTELVTAIRASAAKLDAPPTRRDITADWWDRHRPTRRGVAIGCILALLIVIGLAAAALSFASIAGLAIQCGIPPELAWLLPIVIDAGVVAGTIVWLSRRLFPNEDARRLAAGYTVSLLVVSIAANVTNHVLAVEHLSASLWVIIPVSAIAPATVFVIVHLAVTALRPARLPVADRGHEDSANTGAEDSDTHGDADADTHERDADMGADTDADGYTARVRADAAAAGIELPPAPPGEIRSDRRKRLARERKRVQRAIAALDATLVDAARRGSQAPDDVLAGG